MSILGIHHVALVCSDAQRTTDYYTRVLGLRLLKRTVSPDDPFSHLLFFGTEEATPGCLLSVVERASDGTGREGVGGTHHFALLVETRDGLLQWKRWLTDHGVSVTGPLDRHYFESIYHRDPDGTVIEIATRGAGWTRDEAPERVGTEHRPPPAEMVRGNRDAERIRAESWAEPLEAITEQMRFRQMHHVTAIGDDIRRTQAFVHGALGLRLVKQTSNFDMPDSLHWYWGVGAGEPGTVVTYFERRGAPQAGMGPGQIDHYALAVADEAALEAARERLAGAGFEVSNVIDRRYFRSVFTRDPHGQVVEIATVGPGFAVDEPREALGRRLCLPAGLEEERDKIEGALRPLNIHWEEHA